MAAQEKVPDENFELAMGQLEDDKGKGETDNVQTRPVVGDSLSSVDLWLEMGNKLNLRGDKLTSFIERQMEMEIERKQTERKLALEEQDRKARLAIEEEERKARLAIEERRLDMELKENEARRKHEKELLELRHQQELESNSTTSTSSQGGFAQIKMKLPCFDEKNDDLDTYLCRFERFAKLQHWDEETWGIRLGTLLKGAALEVYNGLSDEDSARYEALTKALRAKFGLTPQCYRKKFRTAKRQDGETFP